MSRLIVVSNRVSAPGNRAAAGGLAVGLRDALRRSDGVWFGWSGEVAPVTSHTPRIVTAAKITYVTVDLGEAHHLEYYVSYSNSTLWPLLHYRLGLVEYRRHAFEGYLEVNRHLARMLMPLLRPDDVIWVHDYHLVPFGAELRRLGSRHRIGYFLHTPFPAAEVMVALPHHRRLMETFCAYDLIGFQTINDLHAFAGYIREVAHGSMDADGTFTAFGQHARAAVFPIGIDTETFADLAEQAAMSAEARRLEQSLSGRRLIIGVDRLDYSKGIPNRFEAIDGLLSDWPEHRGTFNYLQIAPHSRGEVAQYRALRREIEAAAGRINGKFAEFDWTPIRYVNKSSTRATLAGFYRVAHVGLVTPFRDGMNLVAKEFVAAQDAADPGVLILSEFAGAARELDAALIVNPFDLDAMGAALHRSLTMSLDERRDRWYAMMAAVRKNTVTTWRKSFLDALRAPLRHEQSIAG
ncbi:MAG TPA: alpha,alpha-trehalose-phosphate synthase (UDP-forming) [Stellaceae bacterium]|nr:alpha,alpha-trehalose-phosphate synthase (UDP-forming) [Stellaceae bacterium]